MTLFLYKFAFFYLACLACWLLQLHFDLSPVLAAALLGFCGSFHPRTGVKSIIYAGAFAGMCAPEHLAHEYAILFVSLVGASLYHFTKPHLSGFGGKLGTIAFISSAILILSRSLW